jgi:phosphoglycolate phosphatase
MIKMVAFDFDGTVADTVSMCIDAFIKALSPYIGYELNKNEIIKTFGQNEIGTVKSITKDKWEPALKDFYYYYEKMHDSCPAPFPHIYELIDYLKERNIIVPLVTGKGQICCNISLEKLGLESCFSDRMYGEETRNNKAESIIKLLEKYNVKKDEFYYVGDAPTDITACREAGVTCLSAAWSDGADIENLKKNNPDYVFYNIASLKAFLESIYKDN